MERRKFLLGTLSTLGLAASKSFSKISNTNMLNNSMEQKNVWKI